MTLDYVALAILIVVLLLVVYGVFAVWGGPYEIAKQRDHPHQDAIGAATWVSLFTLGALWQREVAERRAAAIHFSN